MSEKSTCNLVSTLVPPFLIGCSSFLQVTRTIIKAGMSSNFDQIGLLTVELAALCRLKKSLLTHNGGYIVTTLVPSFLNGYSSFLQVKSLDDFAFLSASTTALECSKVNVSTFFSVAIDLILLELADKEVCRISWMYSNFGQIGRQTTDSPVLEYPKYTFT